MAGPMTAALAAVYLATGTETSFTTTEPMNEVNCLAEGYPRYSVYEISADTKRDLCISTVPTFEADTAGNGTFAGITPQEIQYPGGRIILTIPRGSTDVVRLATGKHYTPAKVLGGTVVKTNRKNNMQVFYLLGEDWPRRHLVGKDWSVSLDNYVMSPCAEFTDTGGNANSHLTYWHEAGGVGGNAITLTRTNPGSTGSLIISVSGTNISVTLAYADGAITTTAAQLLAALEANAFVRRLGFRAKLAAGETGAGIMAALTQTALSGGLDPEDYTAKDALCVLRVFKDEDSDKRLEGYCQIGNVNTDLAPGKLIMETLDIQGNGQLYRRG
jgi:hypothetical protein